MEKTLLELKLEKYGDYEKYLDAIVSGEEDIDEFFKYYIDESSGDIFNLLILILIVFLFEEYLKEKSYEEDECCGHCDCTRCECDDGDEDIKIV